MFPRPHGRGTPGGQAETGEDAHKNNNKGLSQKLFESDWLSSVFYQTLFISVNSLESREISRPRRFCFKCSALAEKSGMTLGYPGKR